MVDEVDLDEIDPDVDPNSVQAVDEDGREYIIKKGEWSITNRKRGVLTQGDRKYLLNKSDAEGQDKRNTRYRIRQRLTESLLDITLITEIGLEREIEQVLENDRVSDDQILRNSVLFVYDLLRAHPDVENPISSFEDLVSTALIERHEDPVDSARDAVALSRVSASADLDVQSQDIGRAVKTDVGTWNINLSDSGLDSIEGDKEKIREILEMTIENRESIEDET